MKTAILRLPILALFASQFTAFAQDYTVTPANLTVWQLTGTSQVEFTGSTGISLPAGATLARKFGPGSIVLYSVSTPVFSSNPTSWPILQIGPAAIAFTKVGNLGQVVLLVGEKVTVLPDAIALDPAGRSVQPVELALGYSRSDRSGIVVLAGRVHPFSGGDEAEGIDVELAAGGDASWSLETLELMVLGPVAEIQAPADDSAGKANALSSGLLATLEALKGLKPETPIGGGSHATQPIPEVPKVRASGAPIRMEVFTPPAVRHSAVSTRKLIAQIQQKKEATP